jgi:hypothetical protein
MGGDNPGPCAKAPLVVAEAGAYLTAVVQPLGDKNLACFVDSISHYCPYQLLASSGSLVCMFQQSSNADEQSCYALVSNDLSRTA